MYEMDGLLVVKRPILAKRYTRKK